MWLKWNTPHLWRSGDNVLTVLYHDNAGLLRTKIVGKAGYSPPPDIVVGGTISEGAVTQSGSAASSGGLTGITSSFGNEGENLFATAMSDEGAIINELGWFGLKDSSIQYYKYEYDNAGRINWIGRNHFPYTQFNVANAYQKEERFKHDKMDRLTSVERLYSATFDPLILTWDTLFTTTYNKNLMTSNSIVGNYFYNSSKPHALTKVELSDATTISTNTCDLTYTTFNKVRTISEGDYFYDIKYYPNKQQAVSTLEEDGTVISKKQYAGKAFEIDYATNTKYFYVYAHGLPVAVYIQQGENAIVPYFIHTDHLGSVDKITDKDGNIVDNMSFDAWGNRRNRLNWSQWEENVTHLIDRGFTMHQHLDVFNLINMGGRVYDPVVQQFLNPDPYVQMPDNTQNLNRYAYCLNSPTMYTDPSGEFAIADSWLVGFVHGFFSKGSNRFENAWNEANKRAGNDAKVWGGLFISDKDKNGWGQVWEVISRFTWQLPQTIGGFMTMQSMNTFTSKVDWVKYKYGATVANIRWNTGAVTLGGYIMGNGIEADINNSLFQHEYGHYLQSQKMGPAYFSRVGIPSILSKGIHNMHPVEQDANARAIKYFYEKTGGKDFIWRFRQNPIGGHEWSMADYNTESFQRLLNSLHIGATASDYLYWAAPIVGSIWYGLDNAVDYNHDVWEYPIPSGIRTYGHRTSINTIR